MTKPSFKKIYLVDGNAYIHRAYHAIPLLTTSSGMVINAVFGFVRMIFKIIKNFRPEYFCICFDSEKPTFRHKMYKEYKATRKELEEDIKLQFPLVFEFIQISGLPYFVVDGYEADDVISCIAEKLKQQYEIVIVSGDKDMLQLVSEKIIVYNEHKNIWYDRTTVKEKYGVEPTMLTDFFSLIGDKIDNIPGIPGVGPKTACELLTKYGSIEGIYENLNELKPELKEKFIVHREELFKSRMLIKLNPEITDINIKNFSLETIRLKTLNLQKIKEFLLKYEMRSIVNELDKISKLIGQHNNTDLLFHSLKEKEMEERDKHTVYKTAEVIYINDEKEFSVVVNEIKKTGYLILCIISLQNNKIIGCLGSTRSTNNGADKIQFYLPAIKHKKLDNNILQPLPENVFAKLVSKLFFNSGVKIFTYDIKSQMKQLSSLVHIQNEYDELKGIYDILLLYYLVDPNRKISSLQELVDVTLGGVVVAEPRLPNEVDIELFPVEKLILRLVDTLDIIYKIYEKLEDKIMANQQLMEVYKEIDLPMVNILVKMENNGILVDQLYIKNLQIEIETKIKESKNKIFELAGLQFNLNSPKQLSFVLFDKLKLPPIKKKKTGYSTDEEVLQKLKGVHPIVSCILQYRELEKLLNTYIQPLLNCVNPNTNRIHTTFNLTGTATGRLSSENPNMQNIPVKTDLGKKIRQIFIPEEKFKFVSLDYSQIELRILAHLSQDKNLIQAFLSHKDIHKLTAVEIFGINESQVDEQLRRIGKVINFGIIYGITPQGLSKELNISLDVAENYISKYFQRYSEVKEWIKQTIKFAKLHGYVKTLFGRIRPIPEINSTNKQISSFGERLAINTPVQGTAADIIKLAMIKIDNYIKTNALRNKVKMLLQIHDELLFEIHNEVLDVVVKQLKDIMENVICLNVPLEVDITISERWGKE